MSSTLLLIDILGAAALLLWGLRLLKSGATVAFGARLQHFLSISTRNRFSAFTAGVVTTLALQSSTAMAVIVGSFVAQDLIAPMMAQAVMLGSNVGTCCRLPQALLERRHSPPIKSALVNVGTIVRRAGLRFISLQEQG